MSSPSVGTGGRPGPVSLFRSRGGRLRWGWRLGLFVALFLTGVLGTGLLLRQLPLPASAAAGMTVAAGASTGAALLATWVLAEKVEGVPVAALGLPVDRLLPRDLVRGFLLGGGLIGVAVAVMAAAGWVSWTVDPGGFSVGSFLASLVEMGVFLLLAAFLEELVFRGYPFQVTAEGLGVGWALGLTSSLFAVAHAWNPGLAGAVWETASLEKLLPLVNIGLAGLLLGVAYWRTYSLWFAAGVHFGWNWMMGFAADLPVSGLEPGTGGYELFETPGFDAVLQGPALWTGGSFGPEGGLVVTVVSVAGVAWVARTEMLSPALRVRALGPLPDRGRRSSPGERTPGGGAATDGMEDGVGMEPREAM